MSHGRTVIAILMALVLVFASVPISIAGGPGSNNRDGVHTDGGDGHPWDDGTGGQDSTPPDDDNQPAESETQPGPLPDAILMASSGIHSGWLSSALYHLWKSVEAEMKRMHLANTKYKARRVR
ncbi:MAG: hypothetical protein Kow0074_12070 [Candidatus Zixiibacteriota bacterium]